MLGWRTCSKDTQRCSRTRATPLPAQAWAPPNAGQASWIRLESQGEPRGGTQPLGCHVCWPWWLEGGSVVGGRVVPLRDARASTWNHRGERTFAPARGPFSGAQRVGDSTPSLSSRLALPWGVKRASWKVGFRVGSPALQGFCELPTASKETFFELSG